MNTRSKIILFIGAVFGLVPALTRAEVIDQYDTRVHIQDDGGIAVTETIAYDFEDAERHGIYRDIPVVYQGAYFLRYRLRVDNISVTDEHRVAQPFLTSYQGNTLRIKIGDPNVLLTGQHEYRISYTVGRAIIATQDHQILPWNMIGTGWSIPIRNATASVVFPHPVPRERVVAQCFVGMDGATTPCTASEALGDPVSEIRFTHGLLAVAEGLTARIEMPSGTVSLSRHQEWWWMVQDNWMFSIPFIVFAVCFFLWYKKGRDPQGRGTIIPEFEVPEGLMPGELGTVVDERADTRDITAEIIYLAEQGYLKINRTVEEKKFARDVVDYELEQIKDPSPALREYQQQLLTKLFASAGASRSVKLSALKTKFYEDYKAITALLDARMVELGFFPRSSMQSIGPMLITGAVVFFVSVFSAEALAGRGYEQYTWVGIASGIICFGWSFFMKVKTVKGVMAKEAALGLKMYLGVAEKDRIAFHNAPEKNPQQFEKFLPYAMVLGVEAQWAAQFEGLFREPPRWYNDTSGRVFTAGVFASDMSSFRSNVGSTLASVPSSRGGGGSGGGFGGGGGGSW